MIGALRSLQEGRLEVLGRDLSHLGASELVRVRREIGFIFQMHNLFEALSAYENVKMALQLSGGLSAAEMRSRGVAMLERLGLGHRINHKPRSLSGGQRQRVAIARALANRPKLVLADEPTAALDQDSTRNVVRLFKELTVEDGTAILMVTHDHRIIELADRLVHMVDGRIVSDVMLNDALRICEFLKGVELFKTLTPTELTHVAERMTKRHYLPGDVVIQQGDTGHELFLISDGDVKVERSGQRGRAARPRRIFRRAGAVERQPAQRHRDRDRPARNLCARRSRFPRRDGQKRELPRPAAPGVFPAALTDPSETRRPRPNCNPVSTAGCRRYANPLRQNR